MRINRYRKTIKIKHSRVILILLTLICINTFFYAVFFFNKINDTIVETATREIKELTFNLVTKNLTRDKLVGIAAEDLMVIKKNNDGEITDIDFKINKAYEVLIDIKQNVEKDIIDLKLGIIPSNATAVNDNLVIKVPYYSYTKNVLLMNLGPKVYVKVNLLENVIGDVYTKISSYGINTVLINLYLKLYLTESFLYPIDNQKIELEFEVLIATKVIQGKIPSIYNGVLENSSSLINVK